VPSRKRAATRRLEVALDNIDGSPCRKSYDGKLRRPGFDFTGDLQT
jgi:hypothetical protein